MRQYLVIVFLLLALPTGSGALANSFSQPRGTLPHRALAGSMPSPGHCAVNAARFQADPEGETLDPSCVQDPRNNRWYQEKDPAKREALVTRLVGPTGKNDCRQNDTGAFQNNNRIVFRNCDGKNTATTEPPKQTGRGFTVDPNDIANNPF